MIKWKKYLIGNKPIKFKGNNIFINEQRVLGNNSIWKLLCYHDPPTKNKYTEYDLNLHKNILLETDAFY